MKNRFQLVLLSLLFIVAMNITAFAQEEMKMERHYKNIVRLNLTNPVIFGEKSLVLGYERVLGDYKSASINIGQAQLPKFNIINTDSTEIQKDSKEHGFNMTADFRFYLAKENKHMAPRGVYIGPYLGYNSMGRKNTWTLNTSSFTGDVKTDVDFNVLAVGGQLGYQFILFKRIALDLVLIGPGVAFYNLKAKLDTTLDADDEQALYDKINEALKERFPGYTFVLDDIDFEKTGSSSVTSLGFRYVVNVGFLF
jgi:hypothetical protein